MPYSGHVLGAVVDALDVGGGVLGDKTAKRMFAGRSVNAASKTERLDWTLRILSGVSERGCNSMAQGSRKFLDISVCRG